MSGYYQPPHGEPAPPPDYQPEGPEPFDNGQMKELAAELRKLRELDELNETEPIEASESPFGFLYTRSQLEHIPVPETTFGPYIVKGGVNMVYGKWGTYKSFLMLSWAAHLATGTPWNGLTVEPCPVIYWAAEGLGGLHPRLTAWETHHGTQIPEMALRVPQRSPSLDKSVTYDALAELVETTKAQHLMIDTLIRVKGQLRENEADELGGYLLTELAHRICDEYGCSVTLTHHIGHEATGRPRGSSSITDNLDALYEIRDAGAGLKTLHVRKLKDQPMDERPDTFRLIPVGESAVLVPTDDIPMTDQGREILEALQEHSPNGEWVSTNTLHGITGASRNRIREHLGPLIGHQVNYREGKGRGRPSEYQLLKSPLPIQQKVTGNPDRSLSENLPDPW